MAKISEGEINSIRLIDQDTNVTTPPTGYSSIFTKEGELYITSTSGVLGPFGTGEGSGDVIGPVGATDGNVVLFDGVTGKLIKDGGAPLTAGHIVADEATPLTQRATLNFVGAGVAVTDDAGNNRTVVTISGSSGGGHTIQDEGTPLTQRTSLNFVGSSVAVTDDSGNDATIVTITVSGVSGSTDILMVQVFS